MQAISDSVVPEDFRVGKLKPFGVNILEKTLKRLWSKL